MKLGHYVGLPSERAAKLHVQYPRKRLHFTAKEIDHVLTRAMLREAVTLAFTVRNFRLLHAVRRRYRTITIVMRCYEEHDTIVYWLETR